MERGIGSPARGSDEIPPQRCRFELRHIRNTRRGAALCHVFILPQGRIDERSHANLADVRLLPCVTTIRREYPHH
jgi:hypothetical protein